MVQCNLLLIRIRPFQCNLLLIRIRPFQCNLLLIRVQPTANPNRTFPVQPTANPNRAFPVQPTANLVSHNQTTIFAQGRYRFQFARGAYTESDNAPVRKEWSGYARLYSGEFATAVNLQRYCVFNVMQSVHFVDVSDPLHLMF